MLDRGSACVGGRCNSCGGRLVCMCVKYGAGMKDMEREER